MEPQSSDDQSLDHHFLKGRRGRGSFTRSTYVTALQRTTYGGAAEADAGSQYTTVVVSWLLSSLGEYVYPRRRPSEYIEDNINEQVGRSVLENVGESSS